MNTSTGRSAASTAAGSISARKQSHIEVCKSPGSHRIEARPAIGFDALSFVHQALPELDSKEIDTRVKFLKKEIRLPVFISCMTGGSAEGLKANQELAKAAQSMGVPLGLGSFRVLFTDTDRFKDFYMRPIAPDIPILANIGAVQLRDCPAHDIQRLVRSLEVDALVVHLNCGQELFQVDGDADFRGLKSAIAKAADTLEVPLIVKETGFGIHPALAKELLALGAAYVDVAGSGGTNWILVENSCDARFQDAAAEFSDWGLPTPLILDALRDCPNQILASGGLRSGMDLAKSLALGAVLGGMALPFIRSALAGGAEEVCAKISSIEKVVRSVMLLTGSKNIEALRQAPLLSTPSFRDLVSELKRTHKLP